MRKKPLATSQKPQGLKAGLAQADERGASAVEYVLLLGGVGLPIMYLVWWLVDVLVASYRMVSYWITLPFP